MLQEQGITDTFPSNIILINNGYREHEMPQLYKSFDAFVLPTRAEGISIPSQWTGFYFTSFL